MIINLTGSLPVAAGSGLQESWCRSSGESSSRGEHSTVWWLSQGATALWPTDMVSLHPLHFSLCSSWTSSKIISWRVPHSSQKTNIRSFPASKTAFSAIHISLKRSVFFKLKF
jgi:hypothetical protein